MVTYVEIHISEDKVEHQTNLEPSTETEECPVTNDTPIINSHTLTEVADVWNTGTTSPQILAQPNVSSDLGKREDQAMGLPVVDKPVERNVYLTVDQKEHPSKAKYKIKKRSVTNSSSVPQLSCKSDSATRTEQLAGLPVVDRSINKSNVSLMVDYTKKEHPLKTQYKIKARNFANRSPETDNETPLRSLSWSGSSVLLSASDNDTDISPLSTPRNGYVVNHSNGVWCSSTDVSVKSQWGFAEISGWNGIIVGDNAEMSSIGSILNSLTTSPCPDHEVR